MFVQCSPCVWNKKRCCLFVSPCVWNKKHAKLLFAQCSPVSYLEKKNKEIKNQTQHHKKKKHKNHHNHEKTK